MAQHDYDIANQSGSSFRADLNNALDAIVSNNSGSSEPSTTFAYEWWIDTSNNLLKLRNSANNAWITIPISITADNSTPGALTVNGNLNTTGSVDINGQELILDADGDTSITSDTDDQIDFRIGAVDVATLTNSHLVLKGTTPKITIGDGGEEDTALIFDGNAQDFYIGLDDSADDLIIGKGSTVGTTPAITINESLLATFAGDVSVLGSFTSIGIDDNADTNVITIDSQERVGMGTSSPQAPLHIKKDSSETNLIVQSNVGGSGSAIGGRLRLQLGAQSNTGSGNADTQAGDTLGQVMFEGQGTDYSYQGGNIKCLVQTGDGDDGRSNQGTRLLFETLNVGAVSPTERMSIDQAGQFLVGKTSAGQSSAGFEITGANMHNITSTNTSSGSSTFMVHDSSNLNFYVNFTGQVFYKIGLTNLSDQRLKENIIDLDKGLDDILKIKPRRFDWIKGEGEKNQTGFIAQEIEEAGLEELVSHYKGASLNDAKGVNQVGLIPILVKAVQELSEKVKKLEG